MLMHFLIICDFSLWGARGKSSYRFIIGEASKSRRIPTTHPTCTPEAEKKPGSRRVCTLTSKRARGEVRDVKDFLVYLAAPDYEDELAAELAFRNRKVLARHGRVFKVENPTSERLDANESLPPKLAMSWAQDTWLGCEEFEIQWIGDAVKQLKSRGLRWGLISQGFHRRASLIQAELPKLSTGPLEFLKAPRATKMGSWTLLEPNRLLCGSRSLSPCVGGEARFTEDKSAPSRAYLKLWELFTLFGVRPKKTDRCLDLGASPGGWTWVLAGLGCEVVAVDRSPLEPKLMKLGNVEFHRRNAFALKPGELGHIDWFFSDVICFPEDLYRLVEAWLASDCRNFVCTLKFKGATDHVITKKFASIPGSHVRHLSCNKHELTWWLIRES